MQPLQCANAELIPEFGGSGDAPPQLASDASTRSSSPKPSLTTRWGTHSIATPSTSRKSSKLPDPFPEPQLSSSAEEEMDSLDDIDYESTCPTDDSVCFTREIKGNQYNADILDDIDYESTCPTDGAVCFPTEIKGKQDAADILDDIDYESTCPTDGAVCFTRETKVKQYAADIPDRLSSKDSHVMLPDGDCALPQDEMRMYDGLMPDPSYCPVAPRMHDGRDFSSGYGPVVPPPPGLSNRSPNHVQARFPKEPRQPIVATCPISFWNNRSCQQLPLQRAQSGPFQNTLRTAQFGPSGMMPCPGPLGHLGPAPLDYGRFEVQGRLHQRPMMRPTLGDSRGAEPTGNMLDFRRAAPMCNSLDYFRGQGPMNDSLGDFDGFWPIGKSQKSTADDETRQMSLAEILSIFADVPTDTLVVVRRTYKLGFDAKTAVHRYFSQFGPVEKVLLSHNAKSKSANSARSLCPSGLGFVQMQSAAAAQRAISQGSEQLINDVLLRVLKFETRTPSKSNPPKRYANAGGAKRCRQ